MRLATLLVVFSGLWLGLAACEREPAIVIRFDPVDLAGRDLAKPRDLGAAHDAASQIVVPTDRNENVGKPHCDTEADCILVPDECCDCANGGKLHAAEKRDEQKLRAAHDKKCKGTMCTMMVSTDPSCGKRPACVKGACTLRAARPDEIKRNIGLPPE